MLRHSVIVDKLKWKMFAGPSILLRYPEHKEFTVDHSLPYWIDLGGAVNIKISSSSPDIHYRPYLEKHVGKEGFDWVWRIYDKNPNDTMIELKLHKRKHRWLAILPFVLNRDMENG